MARATTAKSAAFSRTIAESMRGMLLMAAHVGRWLFLKPLEVGVREGSLNFEVWQAS